MSRLPDGKGAVESLIERSATRRDSFYIAGRNLPPGEVVERLTGILTEERRERIEAVLDGRTYSVVSVIEGLVNSGNIAAVMRSSEGLGFQRMDIVVGDLPYKHSVRTTQGAEKWLDVHRWDSSVACCQALKARGYRIVATHLDEGAQPIEEFDFSVPTALVFGNELGGISPAMLREADATCVIPMDGFVQSFNISVAAAVALYHARRDRIQRLGRQGDLSADDRVRLRADFYIRALKNAERILEEALSRSDPDATSLLDS